MTGFRIENWLMDAHGFEMFLSVSIAPMGAMGASAIARLKYF